MKMRNSVIRTLSLLVSLLAVSSIAFRHSWTAFMTDCFLRKPENQTPQSLCPLCFAFLVRADILMLHRISEAIGWCNPPSNGRVG